MLQLTPSQVGTGSLWKHQCGLGALGRVAEVQEAAGAKADDAALARMLASGDFDAAEYDRAMAAAFNDDYYEARRACLLCMVLF